MSFNTELAARALEEIAEAEERAQQRAQQRQAKGEAPDPDTNLKWEQGLWRKVYPCGTGMCFAGFTVAVSDREYLVSAALAHLIGAQNSIHVYMLQQLEEQVVATEDEIDEGEAIFTAGRFIEDGAYDALEAAGRMIDPDYAAPKYIVDTDTAARHELRLEADWLDLFNESNRLADLTEIVRIYGKYPDGATCEAAHEWAIFQNPDPYDVDARGDTFSSYLYRIPPEPEGNFNQSVLKMARFTALDRDYVGSLTTKEN